MQFQMSWFELLVIIWYCFSIVYKFVDCCNMHNGWLPCFSGPFEGISYYPKKISVGQSRPTCFVVGLCSLQ